jgi:hypothetical protein
MDTTEKMTRRGLAGLILAGLALPASKALAALPGDEITVILYPAPSPVVGISMSGEVFTAEFASDLRIGSGGGARGSVLFKRFGVFTHYVAEVGGLDFDDVGDPIRAWVLMLLRRTDGRLAQEYALASIELNASEPCRIYAIMGTQVNVEPVRFEVDQRFEVWS